MDTNQTIYTQTPGQVFVKNFLAGFAKGLGGIFVYILFSLAVFYFLLRPQLGALTDLFNTYKSSMQILQNQPKSTTIDLQDLMDQLQPSTTN